MLKALAAALLLVTSSATIAQAQPGANQSSQLPFALDPLPYATDALAPVIDKETMELHHGKHHQAYVDNLNKAVVANTALRGLNLTEILARVSSLPKAVRDNAGGHWNHRFFWGLMAPVGKGGAPSPQLQAAIVRDFGSMEKFQAAFQDAGTKQFGSGWVWLILTPQGKLQITSTPNQDNPLMDLAPVKGAPILSNDVWEHAYYLTYQNRRADYLAKWWDVVNWGAVNAGYAAGTAR